MTKKDVMNDVSISPATASIVAHNADNRQPISSISDKTRDPKITQINNYNNSLENTIINLEGCFIIVHNLFTEEYIKTPKYLKLRKSMYTTTCSCDFPVNIYLQIVFQIQLLG